MKCGHISMLQQSSQLLIGPLIKLMKTVAIVGSVLPVMVGPNLQFLQREYIFPPTVASVVTDVLCSFLMLEPQWRLIFLSLL